MKTFAEIYDSMKDALEYQVEELSLAFTESVLLRMEELDNLQGKELAKRMGCSKAYVSKLLTGKSNFTLETLVKLAGALECHIEPPQLIPNQKICAGHPIRATADQPARLRRLQSTSRHQGTKTAE